MRKLLTICLTTLSLSTQAQWEDVTPTLEIKGNSSYFNSTITQSGDWYTIDSHTNPLCQHRSSPGGCLKGLVSYKRNKYDDTKIRRHSFDFKLNYYQAFPKFVIIYQDWVRIHEDDANGNRPITTVKIRSFGDRLFLQHWDNSWQWENDPTDYDTHLTVGRETMNGEVEIEKDKTYNIQIYTQDLSGSGHTMVFVDGVKISDRIYKASHLSTEHVVMTGMYWSKGFNTEHDPINTLSIDIGNIKHEVLRK